MKKTIALTARYTRHLLTSLVTFAFGWSMQ
jgi:hypothetical protein